MARAHETPAAAQADGANEALTGGPVRRCILTRQSQPAEDLLRLALAPDGTVVPDVKGGLPGRGAWVRPERALLEKAVAKGQLAGALAKALGQPVKLPEDFLTLTQERLRMALTQRLGLARRAGHLIAGFEAVQDALRAGKLHLLIQASDASADGKGKLAAQARNQGLPWMSLLSRDELGLAVGRDNVVHAGVSHPATADRLLADARRYALRLGQPDAIGMNEETVETVE